MKVLAEFEKKHGRPPDALAKRPDLPWYYEEIFNAYMLLSNQRGQDVITTYKVVAGKSIKVPKVVKKPIDLTAILLLAQSLDIMSPKDFLQLVSSLDSMYLTKMAERNG